jgi:HlyD family secretion protein
VVKKLLVLLILLAVGLAGAAWWISGSRARTIDEDSYTFAAVERGTLAETVSGSGVLQPREAIVIGSELSGRVVEINADFNDVVPEGFVLARLDDRMARRKFEQAEIAIRLAQADVERARAQRSGARETVELLEKLPENIGSRKDLIAARTALQAAEATLQAAQLKVEEAEEARQQADLGLKLTVIRVPVIERPTTSASSASKRDAPGIGSVVVDGGTSREKRKFTVMDRKITLNQLIAPPISGNLFTLASDLGEMQLHTQVAEGDISRVRIGQSADFTVSAYSEGDQHFAGRVSEVRMIPTSEFGAIFYRVIVDVRNQPEAPTGEGWKLRPGMTAAVDIIRRRHDEVWKMPNSAISFQLDEYYQTEAARAKLARWQARPDSDQWKPIWVLDRDKKPWPIFIRVGGKDRKGEAGIRDGQHSEVLEWDPEMQPLPDPGSPASYPRAIIGAPPVSRSGFLDSLPNLRL